MGLGTVTPRTDSASGCRKPLSYRILHGTRVGTGGAPVLLDAASQLGGHRRAQLVNIATAAAAAARSPAAPPSARTTITAHPLFVGPAAVSLTWPTRDTLPGSMLVDPAGPASDFQYAQACRIQHLSMASMVRRRSGENDQVQGWSFARRSAIFDPSRRSAGVWSIQRLSTAISSSRSPSLRWMIAACSV